MNLNLKFLTIKCNQTIHATDAIPFGVGVVGMPAGSRVIAAWVGAVNGTWCAQIQVSVTSFDSTNVNGFFFNPLPVAIVTDVEATIILAYE